MEILQNILNTLNQLAVAMPWDALIAAGILSPALVAIKKWLSIQSEKVMVTLVIVLAAAAAGVTYLMTATFTDPSMIGVKTAIIAFMSQPVYFFIVKPAIAWFYSEVDKAAKLNMEMRSAAEPATGLPISGSATPLNLGGNITPANQPPQQAPSIQDFRNPRV